MANQQRKSQTVKRTEEKPEHKNRERTDAQWRKTAKLRLKKQRAEQKMSSRPYCRRVRERTALKQNNTKGNRI